MILDNLLIVKNYDKDFKKYVKIAAFDLDNTIINNLPNRAAEDERGWVFRYKNVISKMNNLHTEGYLVVILSNQSGLILAGTVSKFKRKIKRIMKNFNFPVIFIAALYKDFYRKPSIGMFNFLVEYHILDGNIDHKNSFYVGDAAGRSHLPFNDHSDCDIKFAYNANIEFYTPEEFFDEQPKSHKNIEFFKIDSYRNEISFDTKNFINFDIIFVYGNAVKYCGKTHFSKKYFQNFSILRNPQGISKTNEKIIFFDVYDENLIKKVIRNRKIQNIGVFHLSYDKKVLKYLKRLGELSGKKSESLIENCNENFSSFFDIPIISVPFIFDDTDFSPELRKISQLQL
ncbi:DNA kinase/phosphatase Pnk1 [Hamiltosporidium tvaerminnensis]|nr:DNA kinase/phosphatase Pnk1 [Hamiltosporidium tvaerminnensis]